jgi:hypothetical protein
MPQTALIISRSQDLMSVKQLGNRTWPEFGLSELEIERDPLVSSVPLVSPVDAVQLERAWSGGVWLPSLLSPCLSGGWICRAGTQLGSEPENAESFHY